MTSRVEVFLPWPSSVLSPNNRAHWRKKADAKKDARAIGKFNAGPKPDIQGNIHLFITFHPPSKRAFDLDNALASCKSALDGIADGWGINDKCFRPITIDFGEPVKGGIVRIEIK